MIFPFYGFEVKALLILCRRTVLVSKSNDFLIVF